VALVIAATAMGTWATFAWLFVNLGFDRGTIMPLAILAVLSAGGGVWLLVRIQRVPPLRFIGFIVAFAGVGLVLVAGALAFLRRDWGPAVLFAGILIATGLGMLLYSARQDSRGRR
jgi:FtsH-binding integral membrane protein